MTKVCKFSSKYNNARCNFSRSDRNILKVLWVWHSSWFEDVVLGEADRSWCFSPLAFDDNDGPSSGNGYYSLKRCRLSTTATYFSASGWVCLSVITCALLSHVRTRGCRNKGYRRLSLVLWACIELSTAVHWHINGNLEILGELGTGDDFLGTLTQAWLSWAWGVWLGTTGCRFLRRPTGCWRISDTMIVSNLVRLETT